MDNISSDDQEIRPKLSLDATEFHQNIRLASDVGARFGRSLSRAFEGIALQGKSVGDVLKSLALDLAKFTLRAAFKPLESAFSNAFSSIFPGGTGVSGFASGGVLKNATPIPFAKGGVISSPVTFPLNGRVGLAGEAGAEAILPLRRGADGRLGVASQGGGSAPIHVTMNISTPDVAGFQKSRTQVAAQLVRAVSLGQRNR